MNKIIKLFNKINVRVYVEVFCLSAINSIMSSLLLLVINNTMLHKPLPFFDKYNWVVFVLLLVASFVISRIFQFYMIKFTTDIISDFEINLIDKLRLASYESFEKLGAERVYTAFGDTQAMGQIPQAFIQFINSFVIVVCGLIYMFWISWMGAICIVLLMVILCVFYFYKNKMLEESLNDLRDLQNDYHRYLKDFLKGFRELKMSISRNNNIYTNFLKKNILNSKELKIESNTKFEANQLVGLYSWYILYGVILFVLPAISNLKMDQLLSFIVVLLFISGSVANLIGTIPYYTKVKICAERLTQLEDEVNEKIKVADIQLGTFEFKQEFKSIKFVDVFYTYNNKGPTDPFSVGPLNLEVVKGEVVFITGGNGSGKSTFIYLITGIYRVTSGYIMFNDEKISNFNYSHYSNQLGVVFSTPHLFGENYDGLNMADPQRGVNQFAELMQLQNILRVDEHKNWVNLNLSQGQQKRLALILSMMENRQVIILDEWAAEQDPFFRKYFYMFLIPHLKDLGKTVIAVTHDESYFSCADRIIKFDFGTISSDSKQ